MDHIHQLKNQADANTVTVITTYTANVGGLEVFDVVLKIVNPAANFTITVPDGYFCLQPLLIYVDSNSGAKTVTLTVNGGTLGTLVAAGTYTRLEWNGKDWIELAQARTS